MRRSHHDELGFRHVRFHGLLSDDMGTLSAHQDKPLHSASTGRASAIHATHATRSVNSPGGFASPVPVAEAFEQFVAYLLANRLLR